MTLDDLTLHARTRLHVDKLSAQLPQGLIIEGPVGSGVATVAKLLAQHSGSPEFVIVPKKRQAGTLVANPEEGSVVIEDIRQLYEQTRTKQVGNHVYVIDTGNKSMTIAAQNAFLKLLEEPHQGIHFIIATHRPDLLLPTIVSRCQTLTLAPITDQQTLKLIDTLHVDDPSKQARLAFVGRGRPALLKRLASDDALYAARVKIMTDAKTLLSGSGYDKIRVVHTYRDNRAEATTLLDDMSYQLQTVVKKTPDPRLAKAIDRQLVARERIANGGNIRLQLSAIVL